MYTKIYWIHDFANGAKLGIMPRPRGDDWLEEEIIKLKKQNIGSLVLSWNNMKSLNSG